MQPSNDQLSDKKPCIHCGNAISLTSRFCNACGGKQTNGDDAVIDNKWARIQEAGLFYAVIIVLCALANFIAQFQTLGWSLFFAGVLAIVSISFFAYHWAGNKRLLAWPEFSFQKLCAYCFIAIIGSVFVQYAVGWLNVTFYSRQQENLTALKGNFWGEVILVFFVAVMPAIFEELGFRGYLLQNLLKVADAQQALFITSFLFAIIHMSFLSLFWLIPFALLLGYIRFKEKTLWYGVFMHFFFNFTACMFMLSGL